MFVFDETYDKDNTLSPQEIRDDFSDLTYARDMSPTALLNQLACYLPADKLREFMDDLANGDTAAFMERMGRIIGGGMENVDIVRDRLLSYRSNKMLGRIAGIDK